MKLNAIIVDYVKPTIGNDPPSMIIQFLKDKQNQLFEIFFTDINPYESGMRKWEVWELTLKLKSEVKYCSVNHKKVYSTKIYCTRIKPIETLPTKSRK